ncbi:3-oxoacyl-[acyl-carrier-protein] synthase, mitochondrial-like [Aristolochia californica]|uniref:3-oxoacyl-[acyl-carrier-protein] synthase, mitochondrial-like n=1 Tax=Aristolochia californica TaxID=171875 RepID=UPI0035DC1A82
MGHFYITKHPSRTLPSKYHHLRSRPLHSARDGFVIGECSGVRVLEDLEHAQELGVSFYAEISGYEMSGDADHITQPHTDGWGAIFAMTTVLQQSALHPNKLDFVNAQAISFTLRVVVESNAIIGAITGHASSGALALFSTKGATSHRFGAAGGS